GKLHRGNQRLRGRSQERKTRQEELTPKRNRRGDTARGRCGESTFFCPLSLFPDFLFPPFSTYAARHLSKALATRASADACSGDVRGGRDTRERVAGEERSQSARRRFDINPPPQPHRYRSRRQDSNETAIQTRRRVAL